MSAPAKLAIEPVESVQEGDPLERVSAGPWRQWSRSRQRSHGVRDRATKDHTLQGPRVLHSAQAQHAAPLREVLTPCAVEGHITCRRHRTGPVHLVSPLFVVCAVCVRVLVLQGGAKSTMHGHEKSDLQ